MKYSVEVSTIDSTFAHISGHPEINRYNFEVNATSEDAAKKKALIEHRKVDKSGKSIEDVWVY